MPLRTRTLAIVGTGFPNRRGPTRLFEIALCKPGDPIQLVLEPKNPVDPKAIAIYSERAVQLGYVSGENAVWLNKLITEGREVRAIFQGATAAGAFIQLAFDGEVPALIPWEPPAPAVVDFWPDPEPEYD